MNNRLVIVALALIAGLNLHAQNKRATSYADRTKQFLQTQWWLGFRSGASLSAYDATTTYSGFSPVNYDVADTEKQYENFKGLGGGAGIEITFYHRGFSISFQPNYRRHKFRYFNEYSWEDSTNPDNRLDLRYDQEHQLDYIEFPLMLKYDITAQKIRPFVQAGAYYATLVDAVKRLEISGTDFASGSAGPFENQAVVIGAEDLFIKSSIGLMGGVGASYDMGNIRIVMDITYRHGVNNVTNTQNRFSENQLSGIGDALDDLQVRNVSINFAVLFPLRYLSSGTAIN